ncbi:hypothetical protein ACFOYW_14875 [Gryllotalpicola reticulitermitis]|uniref:Uncharacterized protein n=1 Tax=Gryllotalpicola reticulitermitis TaxID=1184153 RepID=A0ABV8QAV9_9MICO
MSEARAVERPASTPLVGTGVTVPAVAVRAALGVLLLALATLHAGDAWGWIAGIAGAAAAVGPWVSLAWVAMLSLALSELTQPAGAAAWHPYLVLAGLVLAQTLAARAAMTPWRARVSLRVFTRPLLVGAAVAVPCEALLALTLWLRATPHGTWLPAALIAALALLALGALLFGRLLRSG